MMRFCRSRLITSETWSAFRRFESSPKGSAMEPDRSLRKRKHDGFLRLISAVYDIFTVSFARYSPVSLELHRPLSRPRPQSCPTAVFLSLLLGFSNDVPLAQHPSGKLSHVQ